jgi:hypothetical protein
MMARGAGFSALLPSEHVNGAGGVYCGDDEISEMLERFAALITDRVTKELKQYYELTNGHIYDVVHAAVEAEREECAKIAERMLRFYTQAVTGVPEAIRARSKQ